MTKDIETANDLTMDSLRTAMKELRDKSDLLTIQPTYVVWQGETITEAIKSLCDEEDDR